MNPIEPEPKTPTAQPAPDQTAITPTQTGTSSHLKPAASNADLPVQREFNQMLAQKMSRSLGSKIDGPFAVVGHPAGFNYGITYGTNAYYNRTALDTLNSLVGYDSGTETTLIEDQRFSTLNARVLGATSYTLSSEDERTLAEEDNAASAQIKTVLTAFEEAGWKFTGQGSRLDDAMTQIEQAYGKVEKLPDQYAALRNALATYKRMAKGSFRLHSRQIAADRELDRSLKNTLKPSEKNGGLEVAKGAYVPAFRSLPSANQLIGSLKTTSNAVSLSMFADHFAENSMDMHIENKTAFTVGAGLLAFEVGHHSVANLSTFAMKSSRVEIVITYPGITTVPVIPAAVSSDNTGWYDLGILKEIAAKTGRDVTGYKLKGSEFTVQELFGPGGSLAYLRTLVISQVPTVMLRMQNVDAQAASRYFESDTSVKVSLLGMVTLGEHSNSYKVKEVTSDVQAQSVTVTFGPPAVSGTIPLQDQVAHVIGGVVNHVG